MAQWTLPPTTSETYHFVQAGRFAGATKPISPRTAPGPPPAPGLAGLLPADASMNRPMGVPKKNRTAALPKKWCLFSRKGCCKKRCLPKKEGFYPQTKQAFIHKTTSFAEEEKEPQSGFQLLNRDTKLTPMLVACMVNSGGVD